MAWIKIKPITFYRLFKCASKYAILPLFIGRSGILENFIYKLTQKYWILLKLIKTTSFIDDKIYSYISQPSTINLTNIPVKGWISHSENNVEGKLFTPHIFWVGHLRF